jgi:hypothetical protein
VKKEIKNLVKTHFFDDHLEENQKNDNSNFKMMFKKPTKLLKSEDEEEVEVLGKSTEGSLKSSDNKSNSMFHKIPSEISGSKVDGEQPVRETNKTETSGQYFSSQKEGTSKLLKELTFPSSTLSKPSASQITFSSKPKIKSTSGFFRNEESSTSGSGFFGGGSKGYKLFDVKQTSMFVKGDRPSPA